MNHRPVNFDDKFSRFSDQWAPRVVAEINDYQFKIVRLEGDFVWHTHPDTDEAFIVLDGTLRIEFRDGHVDIAAGEMYVVPKGVEHRPRAQAEARVLIVEPRGVVNTGDGQASDRTAENDVWI